MTAEAAPQVATPESPPDTKGQGLLSAEEVQRKLRGSSKTIKELQAVADAAQQELETLRAEKLQREGKSEEYLASLASERDKLKADLKAAQDQARQFEETIKARTEAKQASLRARVGKLPDELKELASDRLIDLDPDGAEGLISKLEARAVAGAAAAGRLFSGPAVGANAADSEAEREAKVRKASGLA